MRIAKLQAGFTLMEILLVMALFAIILGTVSPLVWSFGMQNDLDTSAVVIAQSLRRAEQLAFMASRDSDWGVNLQNSSVIIFSGSSFETRNGDLDEVFKFSSNFNYNGPTEIVFRKFSGLPDSGSSITIMNSLNQSRIININRAGLVEF